MQRRSPSTLTLARALLRTPSASAASAVAPSLPLRHAATATRASSLSLSRASSSMQLLQQQLARRSMSSAVDEESHSDFQPKRKTPSPPVFDSALDVIKHDVSTNLVFLYMKGNPDAPRCGFSANVVRILQHLNVPFASRDVLEEPAIREAVKEFSDWPTLPQLYVKGEFVGGSDIITSLFKSGELEALMIDAGALPAHSTSSSSSSSSSSTTGSSSASS